MSDALTIRSGSFEVDLPLYLPSITLGVEPAFRGYLSHGDGSSITAEKAKGILSSIQWRSCVKSWIFRPIVLVGTAGAFITLGLAFPMAGIISAVIKLSLHAMGWLLLGVAVEMSSSIEGSLHLAFQAESRMAAYYLKCLEDGNYSSVRLPEDFLPSDTVKRSRVGANAGIPVCRETNYDDDYDYEEDGVAGATEI